MNSGYKLKGELTLTVKDASGKIKDSRHITNKIVMTGCNMIASALSGEIARNESTMIGIPTHIACGDGMAIPTVNDVALEHELARVPFDINPKRDGNSVTFQATFGPGVPNADNTTMTEVGIFNAETNGTMLNRATFAVVNKSVDDTVIINWVVTVLSDGENTAE